jgi:hypothetical protein
MRNIKIIKPERIPMQKKTVQVRPAEPYKKVKHEIKIATEIAQNRQIYIKQNNKNQDKFKTNYKVKPDESKIKYGKLHQDLKGQSVYLVAGGPSLKNFDFSRLVGKNVIAINKAFMYVPEFSYLYWTDSRFYNWYKAEIDQLKCKKITTAKNPNLTEDVLLIKNSGGRIIDLDSPDKLTAGNNSGFGAISLALKLGASTIYLLGYDMGFTGSQTHFHEGYPSTTANKNIYKSMMKYFEENASIIKSTAQVYNTSDKSNLTCFDYLPLDKALS